MKVWILLSRFENGGLERVQANLAPYFAQSGMDIWLVAGKFMPDASAMLPVGIPVLEIAPTGKHKFFSGLYRQLRAHRPDILITTSNDVSCLVLLLRKIYFPAMKVVCTQHLSISEPLKHAVRFKKIKQKLTLKAMQWLWPQADAIIAVSVALSEETRQHLMLKKSVSTIYNPVVLPYYPDLIKQKINIPWEDNSLPVFVYSGRLVQVKRVDLLIKAFNQVQTHQPCRLLIVGDGAERALMQELISDLNLDSSCYFAGHQNNPLPWIKAADALVLSSDYEGFGNVLVEAMACGTQVIATDCPHGPAEILEHGRYGQLVPPNNSASLAEAMQNVIDKSFWVEEERLVKRGAEFDLVSSAKKYLSIMNSLTDA